MAGRGGQGKIVAAVQQTDVLVLGAGAAGMFCAIEAARRGRRVVVLDHAAAPGEKIRISGGGRCNFTNLSTAPERFLSENPRFARSALSRFTPADFIARVDAAGIAWHEKTLGQLFCDGSAKQIVAMLARDMAQAGVDLRLGAEVAAIEQTGSGFAADTGNGRIAAASLVVATGGKSIPRMGATGFGYRIAQQFGLPLVETRPGLVPLTFGGATLAWISDLAGISVSAEVAAGAGRFAEGLLFTHRGLSGPSILQVSSYWREGDGLLVDLAHGSDVAAALKAQRQVAGRMAVRTALARLIPEQLARRIEAALGFQDRHLADLSNSSIDQLAAAVQRWQVTPTGSEGYRTAEVTLGGVSTAALEAKTMQARAVPGLYFIGEVVDVTGWLGGYNFQWAWSSGWAAGQVA